MTIRQLIDALLDHTQDGRAMADEVLIQVDGRGRTISASYSDGTFILIAGPFLP